jgi:5-methylcytosine-specific restriction endonuclease McrA
VEEHNGHMLHSQKLSIHAPSVIRLTEYIHIPFERRSLSRKNILLRDHSTCQYCGTQYPPSELTLDHVLPRSRGGESAWDNLVACCKRCNHRKGNRTPEESGMHLLRRPRGFSLHVNRQIMRYLGRADQTWRKAWNPGARNNRARGLFTFRRDQAAAVSEGPWTKQKSVSRRYRRRGTRTASQGSGEVVCSLFGLGLSLCGLRSKTQGVSGCEPSARLSGSLSRKTRTPPHASLR